MSVKNIRKALKGWQHDTDLVRPAVAPTIPHHCSDAFIADCVKLARDFGVGLHTPVSESQTQVIAGYKLSGKSLTLHMNDLAAVVPYFTVALCGWLYDVDIDLLECQGSSFALK